MHAPRGRVFQDVPNPQDHFIKIERLGYIVVGSEPESFETGFAALAHGCDQNGCFGLSTNPFDKIQSVAIGKIEFHKD